MRILSKPDLNRPICVNNRTYYLKFDNFKQFSEYVPSMQTLTPIERLGHSFGYGFVRRPLEKTQHGEMRRLVGTDWF